jgi:hypothetical protein
VVLAVAVGLGASSRARGLRVGGGLPLAAAAAALAAARSANRCWRSAASASSWALACRSRASRLVLLASAWGSSSPRAWPCSRSSRWSASVAWRRISATSASEPVQGAVGLVGGVAGQLGAVQGHGADLDHAGGGAQFQRLHEEAGQGLLVADAEARDGRVVGGLVGGKDPKGDVFLAAPFELAGGAHPKAVAVQQHAQQQLGVVGGVAVAVVAVGPGEGGQVELVDDVQDEPGEVALGEPVAQVRGQQEGLVAVATQEIVGHSPFYSLMAFMPNIL